MLAECIVCISYSSESTHSVVVAVLHSVLLWKMCFGLEGVSQWPGHASEWVGVVLTDYCNDLHTVISCREAVSTVISIAGNWSWEARSREWG